MSAMKRIRRGWHLGFQSLRIVFRDKTLLFFPGTPITLAVAFIVAFCLVFGADELFWMLFGLNLLKHYQYVAIGYAIIAVASVFFSIGLVACVRITLEERDSKVMDGMMSGLKKIHWVVLWALISWTIGPVLNLLDHLRYTSQWVRKIVKTNWSQLSYFLLPVLVIDNINVFSAIRRSIDATSKTWGAGAVSQLGLVWFFLLINIPTLIVFTCGHLMEGPWPKPLTFFVLAMVYATIVIYQTASAVLSVVLYKFALDGTVVEGFDGEWMKEAFVRPKVYVLVDPTPEEGYAPVDEVPAPESVEPIADELAPEGDSDSGDSLETTNDSDASDEAPSPDGEETTTAAEGADGINEERSS